MECGGKAAAFEFMWRERHVRGSRQTNEKAAALLPHSISRDSGRRGPIVVITFQQMIIARRTSAALILSAVVLVPLACRSARPDAAAAPSCDNESLAGYPALLVLAPHPDD